MLEQYHQHNFPELEKKIGITFRNPDLLVNALVHRSFLNENRDFPLSNNERLEFLGDAVLELSVTKFLFDNYGNPEGELTNWRAALVNGKMCASVGHELGLEDYLFLSHGESKDPNPKARDYILANAIEAIVGAIYIDQGYEMADQFITRWIITKLPIVLEEGLWMDAKSRFQEAAQEIVGITPTYKVIKEDGPDHKKYFTVGIYLGTECIAKGEGGSKQEAQTDAAENALKKKKWKGPKVEIIPRNPETEIG